MEISARKGPYLSTIELISFTTYETHINSACKVH